MSMREIIRMIAHTFTAVVTSLVVGICLFSAIFTPDALFAVSTFVKILLLTLCVSISYLVFYSRKDLGDPQIMVRIGIHIVLLLAIVLGLMLYWGWIQPVFSHIAFALLGFAVSYAIVLAMVSYNNINTTRRLDDFIRKAKEKEHNGRT